MRSGFKELISIDEAVDGAVRHITQVPKTISVETGSSLGRVLASDVVSSVDVPSFNRSAVDGYAVRSSDTFGASYTNPITLRLVGAALTGHGWRGKVGPGEAVEISTGAPLPEGADAVVMYEDARQNGELIEVLKPVAPLGNVSRKGEDVAAGDVIIKRGTRIRPWHVAILASMGVRRVDVFNMDIVLYSTGDELVDLESTGSLGEGRIINSTRFVVVGSLEEDGISVTYGGILPDDEDVIRQRVSDGLKQFDSVILTGGSSVGAPDATIRAIQSLSPEYLVHGTSIRPGRPNSVAVINGKPVFSLSGFPVAALTGVEALVKPVLFKLMGTEALPKPTVKGLLTRRVATPINTRSFVRVKVFERGGNIYVEPLALTGSGVLSTLIKGNGILVVPENREGFDEGEVVEVELIGPLVREY
ncbi:molybdopterin molybdenumtransferase MoeA [Thermocladium modestius]|uniref:Molybdopterin molybdenumtransferase MoeA n=1 Tax=Thermocladium modestius TaxID=62609 RepID=A0A830GTH8_9CREN|nr:gephyrin-like molybdotransferase Glp [Thermocladium modestius]GGP19922.1 molybdopterin molybdenumtransferase MoeA [Thermocladium modestius]